MESEIFSKKIFWEEAIDTPSTAVYSFIETNKFNGKEVVAVKELDFFEAAITKTVLIKNSDETNKYARRMINARSTTTTENVPLV